MTGRQRQFRHLEPCLWTGAFGNAEIRNYRKPSPRHHPLLTWMKFLLYSRAGHASLKEGVAVLNRGRDCTFLHATSRSRKTGLPPTRLRPDSRRVDVSTT
jgi:hypothetical protein